MSDNEEIAEIITYYTAAQNGDWATTAVAGKPVLERKITMSSVLFLVNRYLPLVYAVMQPLFPSPTTYKCTQSSMQECLGQNYAEASLEFVQYLPWAMFSALRAYALSSRSWPLAILVFLPGIVPMIINFVGNTAFATVVFEGPGGCGVILNMSAATSYQSPYEFISARVEVKALTLSTVAISSRVCIIGADLMVLGITWAATYKASREIHALGQRTSLSGILLRDGLKLFSILVIMNVLHLSFTIHSILLGGLSNLASSEIGIFVESFLIDLQEANNSMTHQHSQPSSVSSLNFDRVFGALASSLPAPGESVEVLDPDTVDESNVCTENLVNVFGIVASSEA
ncbi:hypothetical protein C8Q74DRAFT_1221844 [Fomes fomentarius]|nr:hypothetical protein C8Q74DRAFT_1221844 [Fomes fomentarius]